MADEDAAERVMVLLEALQPLCDRDNDVVVKLVLATWLAELLAQQAPLAGDDDQQTALLGLLVFVGSVVKAYQELTGQILPPFTLGLVAKAPQAVHEGAVH